MSSIQRCRSRDGRGTLAHERVLEQRELRFHRRKAIIDRRHVAPPRPAPRACSPGAHPGRRPSSTVQAPQTRTSHDASAPVRSALAREVSGSSSWPARRARQMVPVTHGLRVSFRAGADARPCRIQAARYSRRRGSPRGTCRRPCAARPRPGSAAAGRAAAIDLQLRRALESVAAASVAQGTSLPRCRHAPWLRISAQRPRGARPSAVATALSPCSASTTSSGGGARPQRGRHAVGEGTASCVNGSSRALAASAPQRAGGVHGQSRHRAAPFHGQPGAALTPGACPAGTLTGSSRRRERDDVVRLDLVRRHARCA